MVTHLLTFVTFFALYSRHCFNPTVDDDKAFLIKANLVDEFSGTLHLSCTFEKVTSKFIDIMSHHQLQDASYTALHGVMQLYVNSVPNSGATAISVHDHELEKTFVSHISTYVQGEARPEMSSRTASVRLGLEEAASLVNVNRRAIEDVTDIVHMSKSAAGTVHPEPSALSSPRPQLCRPQVPKVGPDVLARSQAPRGGPPTVSGERG